MSLHFTAAGLALAVLAVPLAAQERGTIEFGAAGSYTDYPSALAWNRSWGSSLRMGAFVIPWLSIEGAVTGTSVNRPLGQSSVNVGQYSAGITAQPWTIGPISLLAGGGVDHIDSDLLNTYGGHALIGLKYALWTNVALRADAAQTWLGGGHGNSRAMHLGFSIFRQPTVRTEQITRYDPAPYRAYREDSVSAFETTRLRGVEVAYRGLRDSLMTDHPTASTFAAPSSLVALSTMREKIFFQRNRSELSDSAKKILDAKVVVFNANPALRIIITGYASLPGTDEKNRELGFRRAESAKAYLIARGIDPVRIEISSRGEENPAVEGSSTEANAANRRNQFRILIADPFLTEPKR